MGDVYHVRTEQQPTGDGHRAFGASHVQRQRRSRDPSPDHLHRCGRRAGFAHVEAGGRADRAGSGTVRKGRAPVVLPSCRGSVGGRNRRRTEARPPRHRAHARTGRLVRRVVGRGMVPEAGQGTPPVAVISQRLAANAGAFAAAVLFGSSVVAVRVAVQEVPPLSLAVLRFGQGGLLLVFVLLLVGTRDLLRVRWRDLPLLLLLGAVLFAVFPVSFNASLRLIEASRGALILATIPLWSALLARITRSERLAPRQLVGVL